MLSHDLLFPSGNGCFIQDLRSRDLRSLLPPPLDPDPDRGHLHPAFGFRREEEREERDARSKRDQQVVGRPGSVHAQSEREFDQRDEKLDARLGSLGSLLRLDFSLHCQSQD